MDLSFPSNTSTSLSSIEDSFTPTGGIVQLDVARGGSYKLHKFSHSDYSSGFVTPVALGATALILLFGTCVR